MTIHIDLCDLTPEILQQVKPNMGLCSYTSPCIIGALMPADQRPIETMGIDYFISTREVTIPDYQREDAHALQRAFDGGNWERVVSIASKYM